MRIYITFTPFALLYYTKRLFRSTLYVFFVAPSSKVSGSPFPILALPPFRTSFTYKTFICSMRWYLFIFICSSIIPLGWCRLPWRWLTIYTQKHWPSISMVKCSRITHGWTACNMCHRWNIHGKIWTRKYIHGHVKPFAFVTLLKSSFWALIYDNRKGKVS